METSEVISILSELKDSVHNIRRLANIYKPQSKEIQCISGELIFHLHSLRVFQIQICSFAVQGAGSAHVCCLFCEGNVLYKTSIPTDSG